MGCSLALHFDGYSDNADCSHAVPPPRPGRDSPGKNSGDLVAAFSYMSLEGKDAKGATIPLGFDLDGLCTCPGAPSCKPVIANTQTVCDDPGTGRDNAARQLLEQLKAFPFSFNDATFNGALRDGAFSQLLQVGGYNGTPDDPEVTVSFRNGIALVGDGGAPAFQGGDSWLVEPTSNGVPTYNVTGYVAGGTLVAKFVAAVNGTEGLRLIWQLPRPQGGTTRLPIALTEATITAQMAVSADGRLTLTDGRLGGKLTSSNALELPRAFGVCGGPPFDQTRQLFCSLADLPNKDGLCDTLSFSLAFEAMPAKLGGELDLPVVSPCGDGGPVAPAPSCVQ